MAEYIHVLHILGALAVPSSARVVDVTSLANQKFIDQFKRDRLVARVFNDWWIL